MWQRYDVRIRFRHFIVCYFAGYWILTYLQNNQHFGPRYSSCPKTSAWKKRSFGIAFVIQSDLLCHRANAYCGYFVRKPQISWTLEINKVDFPLNFPLIHYADLKHYRNYSIMRTLKRCKRNWGRIWEKSQMISKKNVPFSINK